MECLEAQELVSEALDNETVDSDRLETAKSHCRTCPECARFVRVLVAVRRSPVPTPRADLTERILTAVEAERTPNVHSLPTDIDAQAAPRERLRAILTDPRRRTSLIAWSSAAAVILVVSGIAGVGGVRTIMRSGVQKTAVLESATMNAADLGEPSPGLRGDDALEQGTSVPTDAPVTTMSSGSFIVLDGVVYRSTGVDTSVSTAMLERKGTTYTALDTSDGPRTFDVLGTSDPARVFIRSDAGEMLGFDRVTTSFQGRTYVLRSGAITAYGQPVTLPEDIARPTSSDGSPEFTQIEGSSPPAYIRTGQSAEQGIALPPGSKPDISADWTWWKPAAD